MPQPEETMKRQQVLADFGEFAIRSEDLDEVLMEACRLVGEALGTGRAKVLEIQEGRQELLVRAGVGWASDVVGKVRLQMDERSSETYSIEAGEPVISRDIHKEDRFEVPAFMKDAGVVAMANVPIFVPGKRPYGILQVDDTQPREFGDDEIQFLRTYASILGPVIDRLHLVEEGVRTGERLQASKEQLRTVLEGIGEQFYAVDRDCLFLFVSRSALEVWGKRQEDVLGKAFLESFPEAEGSETYDAHRRVMRSGVAERIETISPVLNRWIEMDIAPTQQGGLSVAFRDIDARKRSTEALRQSEERLRSAVEVGRLGLWDWKVTTNEIAWSDEHFRMEGYAVGEVTPSYEAWASRIHPDDRPGTEAALRHAMDAHEEFSQEFRVVHPNGSIHWLQGRGSFFYGQGGRPLRMVGAMVDTTERREWEERQKILIAELQHRTRNLMAVVRSMSDRTARASTDLADFRDRFRDRLDALARVQGLLSKLSNHDRVSFDDLVRTELSVVEDGKDRVTLDGPAGIRLRSSTLQTLAMALHELSTNAVKYGALAQPQARLAISWSFEQPDLTGKPWLHIDWRESGVEMPPPGSPPVGTGQGRELIEKALPYQLQAETSYILGPDGVHCTISIPVSASTVEAPEHG